MGWNLSSFLPTTILPLDGGTQAPPWLQPDKSPLFPTPGYVHAFAVAVARILLSFFQARNLQASADGALFLFIGYPAPFLTHSVGLINVSMFE